MNFFENELKKIFSEPGLLENPSFVGRSCFGDLGNDLRVRALFTDSQIHDHYDSLKISIVNRTNGVVDAVSLKFEDVLGTKAVPHNPYFPEGINPYIWVNNSKADWYVYHPTSADYKAIREAASTYLDVFRSRENERKNTSLDEKLRSAQTRSIESSSSNIGAVTVSEPQR